MRLKVAKEHHFDEVIYDTEHWKLSSKMRDLAFKILSFLKELNPLIHGSIARGDIHSKSDIDIVFLDVINEFQIINRINDYPFERWIIQATPLSAIKANLIFNEFNISFPLIPFYPREEEFYRFGGLLTYEDLLNDKYKRVPGINKKLLFI